MKELFNFKKTFGELADSFRLPRLRRTLWNYFLVIFGSFLLALGDELFILPYGIVSGGIASIGVIFSNLWGFDANLVITIAQWVLFVLGTLILGLDFGAKTLLSSIVYPIFLYALAPLPDHHFFNLTYYVTDILKADANANQLMVTFIAAVAGGTLIGLGCGTTYRGGGSTGGVDVISLSLTKFFNIKASITSLAVDILIIFSNTFFVQSVVPVLIGSLSAYVCARMIEHLYLGTNSTYCALIVSDHWKEINQQIIDVLSRGTTLTNAYGGYTGKDKVLIFSVFSRSEYDTIQKIVYKADPKAFVTILQGHEVNGEGFRQIPRRITREVALERGEQDIVAKHVEVKEEKKEEKASPKDEKSKENGYNE